MMRRPNQPSKPGFFEVFTETSDYVQADRIRSLTHSLMSHSQRLSDHASKAKQDAARLEAEVGFLSLIVAATLRTLTDKGVLTVQEVVSKLEAVDAADGIKDGRITVDILRAILGVPRPEAPPPRAQQAPKPMLRRNR